MILKVDTDNSVPVYAQIISQVRHAIASGVIRPGEFLPSLREVAVQLRINPHTVAKAYRELEIQGLVRTDHGRGSYVTGDGVSLTRASRGVELHRLAEQIVVEGYHLGADPSEILGAVKERLAEMATEFEARDIKMEDGNG